MDLFRFRPVLVGSRYYIQTLWPLCVPTVLFQFILSFIEEQGMSSVPISVWYRPLSYCYQIPPVDSGGQQWWNHSQASTVCRLPAFFYLGFPHLLVLLKLFELFLPSFVYTVLLLTTFRINIVFPIGSRDRIPIIVSLLANISKITWWIPTFADGPLWSMMGLQSIFPFSPGSLLASPIPLKLKNHNQIQIWTQYRKHFNFIQMIGFFLSIDF